MLRWLQRVLSPTKASVDHPYADLVTTFFQGDVTIDSFDFATTTFRVVGNGALVSIRNDVHIRLVEDVTKTATMPSFPVLAPMTAVEVLEGEVPENYLEERPLAYYLTIRKHYEGN